MQLEKKQIVKEDGRYLVYFHFPATATEEQTAAFHDVETHAPNPLTVNASHSQTDDVGPNKVSMKDEPGV